MAQRLFVIVGSSVTEAVAFASEDMCATLANYAQEPVEFAVLGDGRLKDIRSVLGKFSGVHALRVVEPLDSASAAPMAAADFIWREDGRPDWSAMWTGFCELALYGGPPHRSEEAALVAPERVPEIDITGSDAITEIRRGIWETTGLYAEPAEPGWIAVTCHSRKMAAWMCASIILENVEARMDDEVIYLPASPDFALKDQVKSVITVIAKVNHYWQAHIEAQEAAKAV